MMKKTVLILGAVLALGLALTGCDDSTEADTGPKSITVTGIPSEHNGKVAFIEIARIVDGQITPVGVGMANVANGKVTFALKEKPADAETEPTTDYTGSGGHTIALFIGQDMACFYTNGGNIPEAEKWSTLPTYNIAAKESTIAFSKFKALPPDSGDGD